jgi:hypothetical protein
MNRIKLLCIGLLLSGSVQAGEKSFDEGDKKVSSQRAIAQEEEGQQVTTADTNKLLALINPLGSRKFFYTIQVQILRQTGISELEIYTDLKEQLKVKRQPEQK